MASDCPICLNVMNKADITYPILCECGYNFCLDCVEHMIESSKSPAEVASDGNLAVKLLLQCPQCRSDLKNTLHDTLILRRAETFNRLLKANDSELTASELRQKHALGEKKLAAALEEAQNKYTKFSLVRKASSDSEEGVEVVEAEETASKSVASTNSDETSPYIDTTLFNGLQYFMTEEEQHFVVELMTSGEASKLAQAAQILHGIANVSRMGGVQNSNIYKNPRNRPSDIENLVSRRSHFSHHTHRTSTLTKGQFRTSRSNAGAVGRALAMGRTEKDREERARLEKIERFNRKHPLPARMPNYIVLDSSTFRNISPYHKNFPIQFADDEWDGTIADAFSRVYCNRDSTVSRRRSSIEGINNILSAAQNSDEILEPSNRVIVSKIKGEAGRQGAQSGDVVTHLNGEVFEGNAEDLRQAIIEYVKTITVGDLAFVLNADSSTAEALKLRSIVLAVATK